MSMDMRLITKGRNEPLRGLAQQARVHVVLARKHAQALAEAGWSPDDTATFEAAVPKLEGDAAARADARGRARKATRDERTAVARAKRFLRKVRNAAPMVLRDTQVTTVAKEAFLSGELRTPARLSEFIGRITPPLLALDADFRKYFGGKSVAAEAAGVKQALDEACSTQEVAVSSLPVDTQALYELKGRVLERIEDLNRVARIAFDEEPVIRAQFNKDVLERARRTGDKAGDEGSTPPAIVALPATGAAGSDRRASA